MASFDIRRSIAKARFSLKSRISIYERIADFLDAQIDIVSTLKSLRDRYAKTNDYRARILNEWILNMEHGVVFSEAIKDWIPPAEHMLISAGERGVGLKNGLVEAKVLSTASAQTKAAVLGGLIFPLALFGMIIGLMFMFQTQQVPAFTAMLPLERWPSGAKLLYNVSFFFYKYLFVVLGVMATIGFVMAYSMGRWTRPPRAFFDKLPPWSIYRSYQASSFLIGLASLMQAGIANYDALRMMHKNASPWMKMHLERMMSAMKVGGSNPGKALDTGLLDAETAGDVQDYSRLGSFQDAIYRMGKRSLALGVKSIEAKMVIIRNLMLVLVAVSIAWMYLTSYNLQTTIASAANSMRS